MSLQQFINYSSGFPTCHRFPLEGSIDEFPNYCDSCTYLSVSSIWALSCVLTSLMSVRRASDFPIWSLFLTCCLSPHAKNWLIGKDSDAGRDWGQEEKGTTEDEMAGWHHWLDGCESGWTPGVGDGQGGLACCDSRGCKESDTTEQLNWTEGKEVTSNLLNRWIGNQKSPKRFIVCLLTF